MGAEAQTPKPKSSKMLRFRQATFMLLAVAIIAFTVASATGRSDNRIARISISSADRQRFQELLDSVDPSALHNVLHAAEDKYRHGIFKEDQDQVTSGGGLSGIDVADNDHVNVHLFLTHDGGCVLLTVCVCFFFLETVELHRVIA